MLISIVIAEDDRFIVKLHGLFYPSFAVPAPVAHVFLLEINLHK